ncbi:MAG: hypothetical protein KBA06_03870, partial [Saprospiraceae bacterium]|nr:hypothetical protein [Saprospiraceae bacterium]
MTKRQFAFVFCIVSLLLLLSCKKNNSKYEVQNHTENSQLDFTNLDNKFEIYKDPDFKSQLLTLTNGNKNLQYLGEISNQFLLKNIDQSSFFEPFIKVKYNEVEGWIFA